MSYKKGQIVKTSQGKTGTIMEEEYWLTSGNIPLTTYEDYSYAYERGERPEYYPYKVQLGGKVVPISYKHLHPVNSVTLGVKIEDYTRVAEALTTLGIPHNFR